MWRLSDEILHKFRTELESRMKRIEAIADTIDLEWREMEGSGRELRVYGVDGSRGVDRRSGLVVYIVSSVAVGERVYRINELSLMKPYRHVDDRIRLHMLMSEYRVGSAAENADVVLMDGTLSGAIIRPPAYVGERNYAALSKYYDLDAVLGDFIDVLDAWWQEVIDDVREGRGRREYLLTRSEYFDRIERGCRIGRESSKEDLMVLLEYVEYLHSLEKLVENQRAVFVAKSHYTTQISGSFEIPDAAVVDYITIRRFGYEKAGYFEFRQHIEKSVPFLNRFGELARMLNLDEIYSAFVRFADGGALYLVESNRKLDVIPDLAAFEVDGYLVPLVQAHKQAEITRRELRDALTILINAVDPEKYGFLLKRGRDVLEK